MRNMYRALAYIFFSVGLFGTFLFCAGVFMYFIGTSSKPDMGILAPVMIFSFALGVSFWEIGRHTKDVG